MKDKSMQAHVMTEMMKFLLFVPSIEGTYIESLIKKATEVDEG